VDSPTCRAIEFPDRFTLKEPQDIVIGYVKRFEWKAQQDTDFQQACNELGIQCVYGDDIPQLIDQGVSAIVQDADYISVDGIAGDMDSAWQNGIPGFCIDAVPSGMNHAYTVSIDYNQWAAISLEWMAEKMGGQGEMILVYPGRNRHTWKRSKNFLQNTRILLRWSKKKRNIIQTTNFNLMLSIL
jgi:ABC-type sugar transport system substrate-binding protein